MKLFFLAILLVFFSGICSSQIPDEARDAIEKYLENTETDADFTQMLDELTAYLERPIRINSASLDELLRFPLINPAQALAIIQHRQKYGLFLHLHELQVAGFTPEHIRAIQNFISVEKNAEQQFRDLIAQRNAGDLQAITTVKLKYPITADSFSGNWSAQNLRVRYTFPGLYSVGISADKDAGEAYWNKGPDFYSFHASIQNTGKIKALVLGDYLLSFGQGLVMGSGIGMGKSALVMQVKRTSPTLRPYRGVNEFLFHRGAAVSLQFKKTNVTMAYALNSLDTRLGNDTNLFSSSGFNSIDLDGLHRSNTELLNKGNTKRQMTGMWLQRQGKRGTWGGGGDLFTFNNAINAYDDLYKKYYPTGNPLAFVHLFQAHTISRFHVFSEWAYSPTNNTKAAVAGLLTTLGRNAEASLVWRHYDAGFVSPFSTAFGNNIQNEQGLYCGIKIHFTSKISLSHYTDIWTNPWLGYRLYGTSRGKDMLWQLDLVPQRKSQLYLRLRLQDKPQNATGSEPVKQIVQNEIKSLRLHLNSPLSKTISLQMRGETSVSNIQNKQWISSLVFVQLGNSFFSGKTRLSVRYSLFDVPYYYNRIFAYESQLLYDFGTAAFYGKGYSVFLLLHQKINRHWKAGLRASITQQLLPGKTVVQQKSGFYFQIVYSR